MRFFFPQGYYKVLPNAKLTGIAKGRLEYLHHNVGYRSVMISLNGYLLEMEVDFVEYEWIL